MTDLPGYQGTLDGVNTGYTKNIDEEGQETTVNKWAGRSDKIEALYALKKALSQEDGTTISLDVSNGEGTLNITNSVAADEKIDGKNNPESSAITWQVSMQEVMKPIGNHPYFEGTSGAWPDTQVLLDQAIKNNTNFDTAASAFPSEAARYFGLKTYGVDNYPVYQPIIKKTTRTSLKHIIVPSFKGFGYVQTIKQINPPAWIIDQLSKLPKVGKGDYNNDGINETITINIDNIILTNYEWLKLPPTITSSKGSKQYDIAEIWRGAEQWAAIFYGGSWDPKRTSI